VADAPVLDVPCRDAASDKVGGQRVHQVEAIDLAPEPTVHEDYDATPSAGRAIGGQPQLPEL